MNGSIVVVDLARGGDVQALRLCIERLIPKVAHAPIDIELPEEINLTTLPEAKNMILCAAIDGKLSVGDAEKLATLISLQVGTNPLPLPSHDLPSDPNEAARIYREFMQN